MGGREGKREMGDVGGGKGRGGRERRGEGGQLGTVTVVLLNGGQDQMCSSYTCQSHYKLSDRLTGHNAHWLLE